MPELRSDGFAPIESYAALGDGRTVALVATDGRIDWYAVPTLDSPPAFAAVLDPADGGYVALAPEGPYDVSRHYVGETNVLETTYRTPQGVLRVTDALNVGTAGTLPWGELARRVEVLSGEVTVGWEVRPGNRFATGRPWAGDAAGTPVACIGDQRLVVRPFGLGEPQVAAHAVHGRAALRAGDRGLLALASVDREPLRIPGRDEVEHRLDATVAAWERWSGHIEYEGPWRREVLRSALVLKLLIYAPTGAIAAAPTTSLPEAIGGDRNWDYRYSWIRDSSFAIDSLIRLRLHEDVHKTLSWLLSTVGQTAPEIHVFYSLDGQPAEGQADAPLRGYRGSQPVRSGNGASTQLQLGNYGDLLDSVWMYVQQGNSLDEYTSRTLTVIGDRVCDVWRHRDCGIWELGDKQHYTISKMGCWVALDRLIRLAECGQLGSRHVDRWRIERDDIKRWVNEHCWSERRRSYTFYAGTDDLDAAVLLAARTGFAEPDGERALGTIAAIREELAAGALLYRYSGMREKEGAFLACSFWLVDALARAGRLAEAHEVMDGVLTKANDVGLFSEEMDPSSGAMLGNFPQGLSHLALVTAAASVLHAERG